MDAIETLEKEQMRFDMPDFRPGDTIKVHVKIKEGVVYGRHLRCVKLLTESVWKGFFLFILLPLIKSIS